MIAEVGGGKGGFKDYLEHGVKVGRDFHRNELDQRIPLFGDLETFEAGISLHQGSGRRYDHVTLSFAECYVCNEILQVASTEFMDHALYAWPEEDRHRIPLYSESHRPRIQRYLNKVAGQFVQRMTHIHMGIGRHDLRTGKAIEPLGYLGLQTDNLKYIDAWQESFNARHGFSSPKDNPRVIPVSAIDVIARRSGIVTGSFDLFSSAKMSFEVKLQNEILLNDVTTWGGLGALLSKYGVVSKNNKDRFFEFYSVCLFGMDKAIRLKGVFFQRHFIELSTEEKISKLQAQAIPGYLEQTEPYDEPDHVLSLLAEWRNSKAREFRYLNTGSKYYNKVYLLADVDSRLKILNDLERNNHAITCHSTIENREITPTRNRLPGMPVRNLDGIQRRTEMLLRADTSVDVRVESTREEMGIALRQTTAIAGRSVISGVLSELHKPGKLELGYPDEIGCEDESMSDSKGWIAQPSSVLARLQADIQERSERSVDQKPYAEIEQNLDGDALLVSLNRSHGLNPSLYQAISAADRSLGIQCGSRTLTPSDFLTIELGLPWVVAASILRHVYAHQDKKQVTAKAELHQISVKSTDTELHTLTLLHAKSKDPSVFQFGTEKHAPDTVVTRELDDNKPPTPHLGEPLANCNEADHQSRASGKKLVKKRSLGLS